MGQLIGAFGVAHTALMIRAYDRAEPAQAGRVRSAFDHLRRRIEEGKPDALIIVSSDHFKTFFLNNMPAFCVGVGEECEGWGDAGVPKYRVRVHQELARQFLQAAIESEFDLAFSEHMPLDHGFMVPLHFLTPQMDVPIVPIFVNTIVAPLPSLRRCYQLGGVIRQVIQQRPHSERFMVVGTGGLSHWVGVPQMGRINEQFDRDVLAWICQGDAEKLTTLTTEQIEQEAGNGAQEIRTWMVMLGSVPEARGEILVYEPVRAWATGIAIVAMHVWFPDA